MSDFVLHMDQAQGETSVSNIFLDEYMPSANGEYVKVYLYLLRCMSSGSHSLSVPAIADRFDHTEKDVHRALTYWEKAHLLRLEYDPDQTLTGICLLKPERQASPASPDTLSCVSVSVQEKTCTDTADTLCTAKNESLDNATPVRPAYSPEQLCRFQEQKEIRQLLFIAEQYLGKTLTPTEISSILYFYDGLGFSADLTEYLIEYCVTKGHKSIRYMEAVALAWHKEGYKTASEAQSQCCTNQKLYFSVLKAFGITGRNPVDPEIAYINKWSREWEFSQELITEACGRTMAALHQPSFEYADSILKSWHDNHAHTFTDIAQMDSKRTPKVKKGTAAAPAPKAAANRFHNFNQRNYDYSELEKQLINT